MRRHESRLDKLEQAAGTTEPEETVIVIRWPDDNSPLTDQEYANGTIVPADQTGPGVGPARICWVDWTEAEPPED